MIKNSRKWLKPSANRKPFKRHRCGKCGDLHKYKIRKDRWYGYICDRCESIFYGEYR